MNKKYLNDKLHLVEDMEAIIVDILGMGPIPCSRSIKPIRSMSEQEMKDLDDNLEERLKHIRDFWKFSNNHYLNK